MKWYNGKPEKLLSDWQLTENPLWADYQVLGPMMSAYRIYAGMDDVIPVMVGAKGCCYHIRFAIVAAGETDFELGKRLAPVLEFSPKQILQGDLSVSKHWVDRFLDVTSNIKPKLVVLMSTDALTISGANLQAIAQQVQDEIGIDTTYIEASSVTGQSPQAGYSPAMTALLRPYFKDNGEEKEGINLIGWHWPSRQHTHEIGECINLLKTLDIPVKSVISGGSSLADVKASMSAKGNAAVCPAVSGEYIEEMAKHGVPFVAQRSPYGFSGTTDWLTSVCKALNLNRQTEIEQQREKYAKEFEENKALLKGKKIFISGGPGRLVGLLQLIADYEMDIKIAALFWPHTNSQRDLNYVFEKHNLNIERFVVSPSLYELEDFANEFDFDVWAGGYQEQHTCKRHNIPFVPITVYTVPHVGFKGTINFGDKLVMAMQGHSFTENVFNAKELPTCTHHSK